jgi:hypothetical protein
MTRQEFITQHGRDAYMLLVKPYLKQAKRFAANPQLFEYDEQAGIEGINQLISDTLTLIGLHCNDGIKKNQREVAKLKKKNRRLHTSTGRRKRP